MQSEKSKEQVQVESYESYIENQTQDVWAKALETEGGRLLVWSILDMCNVYQCTFTGNAQQTFLEGQRNIGLRILNERVFPLGTDVYAQILQDAENRAKAHESLVENAEQSKGKSE